jgi:hypothetical protein
MATASGKTIRLGLPISHSIPTKTMKNYLPFSEKFEKTP